MALSFSLLLLGVIVQLIRRRRLREEYALIWLIAGLTVVLLTVFGGLVNTLASALSVSYPPTLILVSGLLFAMVILLSQSVAISTQADRLRDLAQAVALLDQRLQQVIDPREGADRDRTRLMTAQLEDHPGASILASEPARMGDPGSQPRDADRQSSL